MTYTFKLSRRMACLRAPVFAAIVLALVGCNSADSLNPDDSSPSTGNQGSEPGSPVAPLDAPALGSATFAGGIPIGVYHLPTELFGSRYNGALRNIWPEFLQSYLADIRSRGGKIVLMMAGNERYYKDANGHFSLSKWKARVDRYRNTDFSSYISDGTVIAHYLIDEPNDPANWGGQPVPPSTLEEMAQYSKQLWPTLPTVVRVDPGYLSSNHHYLDAAWAQYVSRKGDAGDYIRQNVADAQNRGLGLIVGLNILKGGPNGSRMSASQVESWGSTLLGSSYPCAFLSWEYDSYVFSNSGMKSAMDVLRQKAENRSARSCDGSTPAPPPPPPPPAVGNGPLPFGLSLMPIEAYSTRWSGTVYRADPSHLVQQLDRAESTGTKVIVILAGMAQSKNADGTFSLTRWKAQVDRFRSLPLGEYVSSKALYLHYLVDQPNCDACWGGKAIPWETVEEMARYSKSIWPSLPTTARVAPSQLAKASFRWGYLDAGWAQYNTLQGDLRTYLSTEVAQARLEGLGLVVGLNLDDATGVDTAPMTASQIKEFGTILAKEPSVCALVGWRYDPAYLSQSGIGAAVDSVATVARHRTAASCVVG